MPLQATLIKLSWSQKETKKKREERKEKEEGYENGRSENEGAQC